MSTSVLFIGLDAAESTLIHRWAEQGHLPNFKRLQEKGTWGKLRNPMDTLPGSIWPEITTGISCGKLAQFYHPKQIHTGEAHSRPLTVEDVDPEAFYWAVASRNGKRVAAVDMPQTIAVPDLNGIEVREWGLHDRNFKIGSQPPQLIQEMNALYGEHPVQGHACDTMADSHGHGMLLDALLQGSSAKADMLVDLLQREHWDLFTCVFGETHCVGHQLWHFLDTTHPHFEPSAHQRLRNGIREVYANIDQGIGRIIEAAGPEAQGLVLASHGMRMFTGGPNLLPEFLERMGMGSGGPDSLTNRLRRLHNTTRYLPWSVKQLLRPALRFSALRRLQRSIGASLDPLESSSTRAAAVQNNRVGAIRLNLKGREPFGRVNPGAEARGVVEEIRTALFELEQHQGGEKIVLQALAAEEAFGGHYHPDVPDILVVFRRDLGPLETCWSRRVGHVQAKINSPGYPRTGDHSNETHLWATGPGIEKGGQISGGNVLDIAPTILAALQIPIPAAIDGSPLQLWL
ncbi:MAG: alkaline phosphatase family protein [Pseudomonadota bacterium]